MEKKNLPVGIEFYKKIIDEAYYYVDKTLMIKELLDRQSYVSLLQDREDLERHWRWTC